MIPAIASSSLAAHAVTVADGGARPAPASAGTTPLVSPLVIEKLAPEVGGPAGASATTAGQKTSARTRTSTAGYASATSAKKAPDPLAFLKDPKLTVEQKLMRLLAHLNERYEADLEQRMRALGGEAVASGGKASTTKTTAQPKKKGVLSSLADGLGKLFPAVGIATSLLKTKSVQTLLGKIGGPVLAAAASAVGFPALAPALLALGPSIVNVAVDAAKAIDAGTASAAASRTIASSSSAAASSSTAASASAGKKPSDADERLQLMEVQRIFDAQKEMFSLVSNILRSGHDTRSAIIGNIR